MNKIKFPVALFIIYEQETKKNYQILFALFSRVF